MIKNNKILGREPAVFFGLVAAVLLAVIRFLPLSPELSGALNAVVLAGTGAIVAVMVNTEKALPALLGLAAAVFALYQAFGTTVPENVQTGVLELITIGVALFTRQNVTAPVTYNYRTNMDRLNEAYQHGFEAGQDKAVPAGGTVDGFEEYDLDDASPLSDQSGQGSGPRSIARPGEESGSRAFTDVMPAVQDDSNTTSREDGR